jgi:hypothetical protein
MSKIKKSLTYIPGVNKKLFRGEKYKKDADCEEALDADESVELLEEWMEEIAEGKPKQPPASLKKYEDYVFDDVAQNFASEEQTPSRVRARIAAHHEKGKDRGQLRWLRRGTRRANRRPAR